MSEWLIFLRKKARISTVGDDNSSWGFSYPTSVNKEGSVDKEVHPTSANKALSTRRFVTALRFPQ